MQIGKTLSLAQVVLTLLWLAPLASYAKPVGEAVSVITDSETMDPNGFKLMVMCIGLLVFLAFSLIGATIFYFAKGKNKQSSDGKSEL